MADTPPESEPSPKADGAPAPATGSNEAPASFFGEDDGERWSVRLGEVFDFGEHGSFTVKERLGRGGMGEVYRAEYVAPHARKFVQVFALKVLRPDARPRQERTFIDEVHLLSLLRHQSIARYHTYFLDQGRQLLVMEYVEGRSLHSILKLARRKGRTLSESTTLELLAQIAEALDYVHSAKDEAGRPLHIVHRDVSPTNIMVTSSGFAKLVDFGVAKADLDDRTQTRTGAIDLRGKLPYLSPEQVELRPLDGRSDLFSLAIVLVEMLTGRPPFGWTPHLDHLTRGLSTKVRAVCRKALARDPALRFSSGCEMARAMLATHDYQGPVAIQEEIAALEALPDVTPQAVERVATAVQVMKWALRAAVVIGALAAASLAAFFFAATPPSAAAVSYGQPMSPTAPAEKGTPTVKDETNPQAPVPEVAKAAPTAPSSGARPRTSANGLIAAGLVAATACVHIHTGAKAGDCSHAVRRDFEGKRVPELFHVGLAESNPSGNCTGAWSQPPIYRDEPCPAYEGPIFMRIADNDPAWYGPPADPKHAGPEDWKPALLIGHTEFIEGTGTYIVNGHLEPRTFSRRMTALITEIQTYDGKKVPVCGVLFGDDGIEGIPILSSPYYSTPTAAAWGDAKVRFYWP